MTKEKKVNTILIASGSGTDAQAIMRAYNQGQIPNVNLLELISTKKDAACLDKAKENGIPSFTLDRADYKKTLEFNHHLGRHLQGSECQLIFLVGCVVRIMPINGVKIYNIHPADIHQFGGNKMYGLPVHERVITNIVDLIRRGKKNLEGEFFTYPTVHEATLDYDSGPELMRLSVPVPYDIFGRYIHGQIGLQEAAARLQKHVLPYEWQMLPPALNLAAQLIIDGC